MSRTDGSLPEEVQIEVLSFLLRDKNTLVRFHGSLQEEHFDNPIHRLLYKLASEHFEKFKDVPQKRALEQEIQRVLNKKSGFVPDSYFWAEVQKVYGLPLTDREYTIERVQDFLVRREVSILGKLANRVASSIELVSAREIDAQYKKLCTVLAGGEDEDGEYLYRDVETRVFREERIEKIPTGFSTLDASTTGGLGKGELGIVLAPTGYGKSALLIQLGLNASRTMKNVLHVSLEMKGKKVMARYVASGTKINKDSLYELQGSVRTKLKKIQRLIGGADIYVKGYPTDYATIDMIRGFVQLIKIRDEFKPDLVIVDYADLIRVEYTGRQQEQRHVLGLLYKQLRGLAQELDVPLWSASQTNRAALSKPIITINDIAESFQKVQVSDIILGICRTRQERKIHEGRLFIAKNRDNPSEIMISIKEDFAKNLMWEISNPTISAEQFELMQQRYDEGINDAF